MIHNFTCIFSVRASIGSVSSFEVNRFTNGTQIPTEIKDCSALQGFTNKNYLARENKV